MFEIVVSLLFAWLFISALRLMFKVAWGLTKVIAVILMIAALPLLVGILLIAGGFALLLPVALIAIAVGVLKICT